MLIKDLERIAAKELKNTRGVHPQYKDRLKLVEAAYGTEAVRADFLDWAVSVKERGFAYPISEYLKVVDSRFRTNTVPGGVAEEQDNPQIVRLSSQAFTLTGRVPIRADVIKNLQSFSGDDLFDAFAEYVGGLEERELKYATRNFYSDGGAEVVIGVRTKAAASRIPDQVVESVMAENNAVATENVQKELTRIAKEKEFEEAHRYEI